MDCLGTICLVGALLVGDPGPCPLDPLDPALIRWTDETALLNKNSALPFSCTSMESLYLTTDDLKVQNIGVNKLNLCSIAAI